MSKRGRLPKPIFEPCQGGGVILRVPVWADYEDWVNLRRENRAHLQPWEPMWKEEHLGRQAYKARLARFKSMISHDQAYPFHLFKADQNKCLIGACNLTNVQRGSHQSAHIGYWVGKAYGRQGYARAAVQAALRFAFNDLGLHRIVAAVQPNNTASIRLLKSAGFTHEGVARSYLKIDGHWQDHEMFAKLSSD